MIELGVFHNGASDLPAITTPEDVVVNNGFLDEVHHSYQRVLVSQVRQGILAEHLGFDYWFMTEHHFMPEGPVQPEPALGRDGHCGPHETDTPRTDGQYPALVASHSGGGASGDAGRDQWGAAGAGHWAWLSSNRGDAVTNANGIRPARYLSIAPSSE